MNEVPYRMEITNWKFALDQSECGELAGWLNPAYDDSNWKDVTSYTSWETYEYAMESYEGCGWFRAHFRPLDACPTPRKLMLHFEGIGGTAKVYVNGRYVGGTENRYLPFSVDITKPIITHGDNVIAVRVDNSWRGKKHLTGGEKVEWVLYGGLTHKVYYEEQPSCHIKNVHVDGAADGTAQVTLTVENRIETDFHGTAAISVEGLPECTMEREIDCAAFRTIKVKFTTKAENAKLWSPESPNLYKLTATLHNGDRLHQTITQRYGYRTIAVDGTKILLNGEEILIKGVNRYDEYAPYGICPPEDVIRQDLQAIKDMGANLIRTHYPQDRIHYEIADELGLMYMIEVPINWWNPTSEETMADYYGLAEEAVDTVDRTMEHFGSHPCWIIWSISNECSHSHPACQELFRALAQRMRQLQCNRLVTVVLSKPIRNSQELDFCDIISQNCYPGCAQRANCVDDFPMHMQPLMDSTMAALQKYYPDKPHIMSEFGCVSIEGFRTNANEGRFSEDFAETVIRKQYEGFLKDPAMKGLVLWCWADYRHHRRYIPIPFDMGMAAPYGPYGLVSMDRKPKKLLLDMMKELFEKFRLS